MTSSLSPPEVPNELYVINREKLIKSLRGHLSSSSRPHQGFVFLQGGEEQSRYCTDHDDLFRQESYFAYLFGVKEPGFYGAIDVATGDSMLFAPRLPDSYAVWLGKIKPLSYFKEKYRVNKVFYTDEIVHVLLDLYKEKGNPLLFLLHGLNTDSNKLSKPADFQRECRRRLDLFSPLLLVKSAAAALRSSSPSSDWRRWFEEIAAAVQIVQRTIAMPGVEVEDPTREQESPDCSPTRCCPCFSAATSFRHCRTVPPRRRSRTAATFSYLPN
ncbi:unnamed protein product [Cuscuta campestris]|uniref:Aminopeptidase P N-terminal domain-containing protein n=1 Tax=Cuscuta campestris TaxID=132261 RepID=A0A484K1A0_9ASTE|nr:unnamed protein product [Cuscuta campestris]